LSGLSLFQCLEQHVLFPGGEKCVQVVDQDETVTGPGYAGDIFRPVQHVANCRDGVALPPLHDAVSFVHHQRDRERSSPGDDELIRGADFFLRQPESLSHIHDGNDFTLDIQDAENDIRCPGERGDCRRPYDPFDRLKSEGILLLIERKD